MKGILVIVGCFVAGFVFSESLPKDYWRIKSDQPVDSINSNVCLVHGVVKDYLDAAVEGGLVSTLDRSKSSLTDSKGRFMLYVNPSDTALFFFHEKYSEIVCWNYNFQAGHVVEMEFVTSEKLPDGMIIVEEKPVVYLESAIPINCSIEFENSDQFTFTYPTYEEEWNIKVNGNEITHKGNSYPYLFWEGQKTGLRLANDPAASAFAATDTLTHFFESYCADAGFNNTQTTDFITYWMPRMSAFQYVKFEILLDETYSEVIGDVFVHPKPDLQRRLFLVWEGYNEDFSEIYTSEPEQLKTPKVAGFSYMEWGGAEIQSQEAN